MNLCRSCGQDFGSLVAFDKHRVGKHAYTYDEALAMVPPRDDGRRCLSLAELGNTGFVRNSYGRWSIASHAARGREQRAQRGRRP